MSPRPLTLPDWFREIDTADSGVVSREQFIAHRLKPFDQLDANKDGVLDLAEFIELAQPPFITDGPGVAPLAQRRAYYEQQFRAIDTNDDGKVSRAEFQVSVALSFREIDIDSDGRATREEVLLLERTARNRDEEARRRHCLINPDCNGDGVIDLEEFTNFETTRLLTQLGAEKDGQIALASFLALAGPTTNLPGQPPYAQRREAVTRRFNEIDADRNGVIDAAEIRVWATAQFKRIDLDGDGKINPTEWQVASTPQAAPPPPATTAKPPPGPGPRPVKPPPPQPPPPPPGGLKPGAPLR